MEDNRFKPIPADEYRVNERTASLMNAIKGGGAYQSDVLSFILKRIEYGIAEGTRNREKWSQSNEED